MSLAFEFSAMSVQLRLLALLPPWTGPCCHFGLDFGWDGANLASWDAFLVTWLCSESREWVEKDETCRSANPSSACSDHFLACNSARMLRRGISGTDFGSWDAGNSASSRDTLNLTWSRLDSRGLRKMTHGPPIGHKHARRFVSPAAPSRSDPDQQSWGQLSVGMLEILRLVIHLSPVCV